MRYKGNVLYFEGETNVQVLTFYTGPKSRKYVAICGMKLKKKSQAAYTCVLVTYTLMLMTIHAHILVICR